MTDVVFYFTLNHKVPTLNDPNDEGFGNNCRKKCCLNANLKNLKKAFLNLVGKRENAGCLYFSILSNTIFNF